MKYFFSFLIELSMKFFFSIEPSWISYLKVLAEFLDYEYDFKWLQMIMIDFS